MQILSMDREAMESCLDARANDGESPDRAFDRQWALQLLEQATGRLRSEYARQGREALFDALKPALAGDRLAETYATIAPLFGMEEGALKVAVHRLRKRYREVLREEIAATVEGPAAVDEEMGHLLGALS